VFLFLIPRFVDVDIIVLIKVNLLIQSFTIDSIRKRLWETKMLLFNNVNRFFSRTVYVNRRLNALCG